MTLRLFCFPHAGGGPAAFRGWRLPSTDVVPVVYPGRATRMSEAPLRTIIDLAADAEVQLRSSMREPFAFFGHSMGAYVAFELTRRLAQRGAALPKRLIVSAALGPRRASRRQVIHDLSDDAFREELRRLSGTPRELLDNEELMTLLLPMLRADFEAVATYRYTPDVRLDVPIVALGGDADDAVSFEDLAGWNEETSSSFLLRMLPGDHFFIHRGDDVLRELERSLERAA